MVQPELNFDPPETVSPHSTTPIEWLGRSYASLQEWQGKAFKLFLSVNGDSNVARNRLVSRLRKYFRNAKLVPLEVRRWKEGKNEIEIIHVNPPKNSICKSGYVDWLQIADLLLKSGCADMGLIERQQKLRDAEFRKANVGYMMRLVVESARDLMRSDPGLSDHSVREALKEKFKDLYKGNPPPLIAVKEARKLLKSGVVTLPAKAPIAPASFPRYESLYQ